MEICFQSINGGKGITRKIAIMLIVLMVIGIGFLSGCTNQKQEASMTVIYYNNAELQYTLDTKVGYRVSSETIMIRSDLGTQIVDPKSTVKFKGTVDISDRQTFDIFVYMQELTGSPLVEKNGVTLHSGENEIYISYP